MTELHFPVLESAILIPLAGAAFVRRTRNADRTYRRAVIVSALTLVCAIGAWLDFAAVHAGVAHPSAAHDRWDVLAKVIGREVLVVDELTAPLLPTIALLYFLTTLATQRTKLPRFSFPLTLIAESLLLAAFSCREPWTVIGLLALGTVPPYLDLRARGKPTRVYVLHMTAFVLLLAIGWTFVEMDERPGPRSLLALFPLLLAVCLRSGLMPFQCWMADLFEHASFGTALLYVTPITGAYAAVRLLIPIAPDWILQCLGLIAMVTTVYAAGMALVQREARRFFCYLFLSYSALVLVGLEIITPIGLTGGLCVWLSAAISLGGLGLTLRALEARFGRLSLDDFHGLYEHVPALAICFAIAGLAGIGFPGTAGFIGIEMLIDGAVTSYPHVGIAVLFAAALNGIAVLRAYFLLFTGRRHSSSVSLQAGTRERIAVTILAALLLGGGLFPQPSITSRHEAAVRILRDRESIAAGRPVGERVIAVGNDRFKPRDTR